MNKVSFKKQTILLLLWFLSSVAYSETKNGFRLDNSQVPVDQIFQGGPPRDGIPSIDEPHFILAKQADFLKENDRILGLHINGIARAYPINILNWHEIVNDVIAGEPVIVTFCPLCGTGMAFEARVQGKALEFGVSGLLYQSDVLLYDRTTFSLWSQIMRKAVVGSMKGRQLKQLPLEHTTWKDWLSRYPNTQVLSTTTGFSRDYARSPYSEYEKTSRIYFEVNHIAPAVYHPKEQVIGLLVGDKAKAYPFSELSKNGMESFRDSFSGESFTVHWNESARSAYIINTDENSAVKTKAVTTTAFWFAWYTFHPGTEVFKAP